MNLKGMVLFAVYVIGSIWAVLFPDDKFPGDVFFYAFTAVTALTLAVYVLKSPWRSTNIGRGIVYLLTSCLAIGVNGTLALWLGADYPGRWDIRNNLLLLAVVCVANIGWSIRALQLDAKRAARGRSAGATWAAMRPDTANDRGR